MKAILSQNSSIQAQTIKRFASHYHDETFNDQHIASATSIRKQLFSEEGSFTTIEPFSPTGNHFAFSKLQTKLRDIT